MRKRGKNLIFLLFFILLLLTFSNLTLGVKEEIIGVKKHMKLLAVQENGESYNGSIAELYLELNEGSGRVFLETFPLTRMDTQISTRFAKEIACDYFGLECNHYDFIYTIKASSNIVGGPSAGAAIAALTAITVLNLEYDAQATITGTINSGGIIGPVSGVKEKLEAASQNSLEKVLVARGGGSLKEGNKTIDLIKKAKEERGLVVTEVGNLNEVVFQMTGQELKKEEVLLEINAEYQNIMEELAELLCERTEELEKESEKLGEFKAEELAEIEKKRNSSRHSWDEGDYYSAASFCFGANILIKELIFSQEGKGNVWLMRELERLGRKVELMEESIRKEKIETIADLQALMVVKERLGEVKEKIKNFDGGERRYYDLAYAEERFFSAISWMYFFEMAGKEFVFNKDKLKESCMKKISEAEERHQYVELIFGGLRVGHIRGKLEEAKKSLGEEEYDFCLIKGAQAKAEANAILSSMGLDEENFAGFLDNKFKAVEGVIGENSLEGVFPILGYSYYQYANTLREKEKPSALLYLEYALEMSDLDIYFKETGEKEEKEKKEEKKELWSGQWLGGREFRLELTKGELRFIQGFLSGGAVIWLIFLLGKVFKRRKERKKSRIRYINRQNI